MEVKYSNETQKALQNFVDTVNAIADREKLYGIVEDMMHEIIGGNLYELFADDDCQIPINERGALVLALYEYLDEVSTQAFIAKHSVTRRPETPAERFADLERRVSRLEARA